MSTAEVTIEAIEGVSGDLRRYVEQSRLIMRDFGQSSEAILTFLDEVIQTRRRAVHRAREEAHRAEELERVSERSSSTNWLYNSYSGDLHRTLANAEDSLERAIRVREQVMLQLRECQTAIRQNENATTQVTENVQTLLRQKREELEAYLAGATQVSRPAPAPTLSAAQLPSVPETFEPGQAFGPPTPGLPPGFAIIKVSAINDSDSHVLGPADFGKGYSPEDLKWAHEAFIDVVLPTLCRGGSIDDLRARDHAEGRVGVRSYADTYSGFLGDSAIKINKDMTVSNGYHRIWVAKKMGLDSIPARIT